MDRLRRLARSVAVIPAAGVAEQALLGHLLGAIYALDKSDALGIAEPRSSDRWETYPDELQQVAQALACGERPPDTWLADAYLNSAIYRLAALDDRIAKYRWWKVLRALAEQPAKHDDWKLFRLPEAKKLYEDANSMKHGVSGVLKGRKAKFDDAVALAETFVELLRSITTGTTTG